MSKHTPGPWFIYSNGHCVGGPDPANPDIGMSGVAMCAMARRSEGEAMANARLIAAAPDLKFELLCAANYVDALGGDSKPYRQLLAKVEGEA